MNPPHLLTDMMRMAIWLILLVALFVPLEMAFERVPVRRDRREWTVDIGYYFLGGVVASTIVGFPAAALVAVARHLLPSGYIAWLNGLPLWLQLCATFVVGEFGFYWGHRWSHRFPVLWRFHMLHHRPEKLYWLINTRAHPVDLVFSRMCGLIPLYLLGLSGRGAGHGNLPAILFTVVGLAWSFFIHANVRWNLGWIDRLIATPRFHHWHHTRDAPLDRNFASMLPVMDRIFGTLHLPKGQWPAAYGIAPASATRTRTLA